MKKRVITLLLAVLLLFSLSVPAFALWQLPEKPVVLDSPKDMLNFGLRDGNGPVSITKCVLHVGLIPRTAYLICLSGADYDLTKHNNFAEFFLSAATLPTGYLRVVKDAALATIPKGANVLLIGHSLGGTTAQQFAADSEMCARYNILNVCACGSPYIPLSNREGSLHRLSDVLDPIPQISIAGPVNLIKDIVYDDGGYFGKLENPHEKSYYKSSVWDSYDCFGVKYGMAYITCRASDIVNFSLKIDLF